MNKPTFPIAIFFQPARNIARAVAAGATVFCGPEVENRGALSQQQLEVKEREWIDAVGAAGAWVVLKHPKPPIPAHCYAFMLNADEPDGHIPQVDPGALRSEFDRFRALDPNMPVVLSLDGSKITSALKPGNAQENFDLYRRYLDVCHIATVDPYPKNRNANRYPTSWPGDAVAALKSLVPSKKIWAWLEVNDQQLNPPAPPDVNREPSPAEIKEQFDKARAAGADGIGWFLTQDKGKYGWPGSYWPEKNRNGHSVSAQYDMMRTLSLSVKDSTNPIPTPVPVTPTPLGTPQIVLILGNYKDLPAHKALADKITQVWKPVLGNAPFFVSKWDNDVAKEINTTYPAGPLRIVGFSFGGSKAVDVCRELGNRPVEKLILIDPVPRPPNVPHGPGQFPGFDIPANVVSAWCAYRLPSEQKTLFSSPIRTGREFTNYHYVIDPGQSEEGQHGQLIWNGVALRQVTAK